MADEMPGEAQGNASSAEQSEAPEHQKLPAEQPPGDSDTAARMAGGLLPPPWIVAVDRGSGREYYWNAVTNEAQWTLPAAVRDAQQPGAAPQAQVPQLGAVVVVRTPEGDVRVPVEDGDEELLSPDAQDMLVYERDLSEATAIR